jgi:hypothetical protein
MYTNHCKLKLSKVIMCNLKCDMFYLMVFVFLLLPIAYLLLLHNTLHLAFFRKTKDTFRVALAPPHFFSHFLSATSLTRLLSLSLSRSPTPINAVTLAFCVHGRVTESGSRNRK